MRLSITTVLCIGVGGTTALADPVRWSWSPNDPNGARVDNSAGAFHSIKVRINDTTSRATFRVVFSERRTDGFTFVLNDGQSDGAGQSASIFVDRSRGGKARVSAYAYNGANRGSFRDGDGMTSGRQAADVIYGYQDNDWIKVMRVRKVGKDKDRRVFRLSMDVSSLLGHSPMYGDSENWLGFGFGAGGIGAWIQAADGLRTVYGEDGALKRWRARRTGEFETIEEGYYNDQNGGVPMVVAPLPGTWLIAASGLGLLGARRRRMHADSSRSCDATARLRTP